MYCLKMTSSRVKITREMLIFAFKRCTRLYTFYDYRRLKIYRFVFQNKMSSNYVFQYLYFDVEGDVSKCVNFQKPFQTFYEYLKDVP